MNIKRFLLLFVMGITSLSSFALANLIDGIYYNLYADNTAEVTNGWVKYTGEITIPTTVTNKDKTYTVTKIANKAFRGTTITSVSMPNSLMTIGDEAFSDCKELTSISIPEGVISIGNSTFSGCEALTSISIPEGVTSIGNSTFYGCEALTSISIPEGVTSIGNSAFAGCKNLTKISFPQSLTTISQETCYGCANLKSVLISDKLTSIGQSAFRACFELETFKTHNSGISLLPTISLPESIEIIGERAFQACEPMVALKIPTNLTNIGAGAFSDCPNIESIVVESGNNTYDSRNNCNAIIHSATNELIAGCKNTIIPTDVTSIGESAFSSCYNMNSIELPQGLTNIGDYAFAYCQGLTSIDIPSNVKNIGDYAFAYCRGLTSIDIPHGVTKIGNYTFLYCQGLTSIDIPHSVTTIGMYAFKGCNSLTNLDLPNSLETIGLMAFCACEGLVSVVLPNSLTEIGSQAFFSIPNLKSVISMIEEPFKIGEYVFMNRIYNEDQTSYTDTFTSATLYVPAGTKEKYESTAAWNKFENIVEGIENDVQDILTDAKTEVIERYNMNGQRIATPVNGINIIRYSDGSTKKVMVRQ